MTAVIVMGGCHGPQAAVLGTGYSRFIPIAPTDSVPIAFGTQGCYFIAGSLLLRNVPAKGVQVSFSLRRADDGSAIATTDFNLDTVPLDPSILPGGAAVACPLGATSLDASQFDFAGTPDGGSTGAASFCLPGGTEGWSVAQATAGGIGNFVLLPGGRCSGAIFNAANSYHQVVGTAVVLRADVMHGAFADERTFLTYAGPMH